MTNDMSHLDEIKNNVISCQKCNLHQTRTNAVPGKGAKNANIMFIGEAPGRSEDARGEPFVGAAGTKLTAALHNAGLDRSSVYITNVVKCRPPDNRVPSTQERQMCLEYLREEIRIINPKIICILGNTAFGSILGGTEITKHRGKVAEMGGRLYYITIHPAATIYNQKLVDTLYGDIKELASITRKLANKNASDGDNDNGNNNGVKIDIRYDEPEHHV